MATRLDAGQKHLLNLVVKGADKYGWVLVSAQVFPLMQKIPRELVELESVGDEGRGQARLTEECAKLFAWL